MKSIVIIITAWLLCVSATGQEPTKTEIHRLQATTKAKSGQYFAKSTKGHFSVLLPLPFNDFTLTVGELATHGVGVKSSEGIKFSVMEAEKPDKNKVVNLDDMASKSSNPGAKVTNVKREKTKDIDAISYTLTEPTRGAITKYIITRNYLFTMIIEFPIAYKKLVEEEYGYFFSSMKITSF